MPTIIAVDTSLSMVRPIEAFPESDTADADILEENVPTKKALALEIVNKFVDHVSAHCKLELVSLITFSSSPVVRQGFTRELNLIRESAKDIPTQDTTNFSALRTTISKLVMDSYGSTAQVQILLVTDGSLGFGAGSLRDAIRTAKRFPFSAKLNVIELCDPEDKNYQESKQMFESFVEITCGDGCVYLPEGHLNSRECLNAVENVCSKEFTPYKGTIKCGTFSSKVTLCPPPQPFVSKQNERRYDISENIEIIGFIQVGDLACPPIYSRHLLLPLKSSSDGKTNGRDDTEDNDGNVANFCVLLHGALKVATEPYCAFCEVGSEWFGFVHSFADTKSKKSNLILSILSPGTNVVPWLGNLHQLGPKDEFVRKLPTGDPAPPPTFPVKSIDKKSYISTPIQSTVWLTAEGLNADIQKLLRHARKLPEKTVQFYKELNRMRRWALGLGFTSVLETLAAVLERECISTSHPEASIQLTFAASQLRSEQSYSHTITHHVAK